MINFQDYFPLYIFVGGVFLGGLVLYNWGCGIRYKGKHEEEGKNDKSKN